MIEQIFANSTRFFLEDAIGSGSPSGNVVEPRLVAAAAGRNVAAWEARTTPFRVPSVRQPIHNYWNVRTSLELSAELLETILTEHMTLISSGVYRLDRESPSPTFCLQVETEDGDLIDFRGLAMSDLSIKIANNQIGSVEITWLALQRLTGNALDAIVEVTPAATPAAAVGPGDVAIALVDGSLAADTRSDVVTTFGADFFLTRPGLQITNFDPNGIPQGYNGSPWRITGSISALWDSLADSAASDRISGAAGLLIGADGADLDLRFEEVSAYLDGETIKADDFREARYLIEVFGDSSASLLELRT